MAYVSIVLPTVSWFAIVWRCVVLVATGKSKAEAVYRTICGPITPEVPASILQLHPCCVILTDTEAASLMRG